MKIVHVVSFVLLVVGGLNWGWAGVSGGTNLLENILGAGTLLNTIYVLVGLSAILAVVTHKKDCKGCSM